MNRNTVDTQAVYAVSPDIISREIEGELIILPFQSGVGNIEDDMYTLNATGKTVWERLNGRDSLEEIIASVSREFDAPGQQIKNDIVSLIQTLLEKQMIIRTC